MLPNSLTKVLPIALVYSTHLPVSVCGTSTKELCLETFLGNKAQPLRLFQLAPTSAQPADLPTSLNT